MIALLVTAILAQQSVPSVSVPPAAEAQIVFSHAGFTYVVGRDSGKVTATLAGADILPDNSRPKPPPMPSDLSGVKWFSVIVDGTNSGQQSWRTSPELRKALADRGIQFRSYVSEETDIDTLGFRTLVGQTGLPTVILQDGTGKLVKVISPKSLDDITALVESIR
ncbi:hypothetical protein UFOVP142_27 [uncultured Caudovirales phage]|uniref:Thioredoxin n=1 Tax=uncultured Caudovirales phage TaxID=2100421 RepID=A0A6J7XUE1_9CAUD|nr:hypothetical protein UFOVP142_27 [uncultured Caudovirales phage]